MRALAVVGVLLALVLILTGCEDSASGELVLEQEAEVQTLTVRIYANGRITFRTPDGVELPALLGTGEPDDAFNPTSYYGVPNTLTIRINGQDLYFDLHNTVFRLEYRSMAYVTSDLTQYGKDLILIVEPGQRSAETVTLIAMNERIKTESTRITLEYVELDSATVRVFFEAQRDPDASLTETDPGLLEPRASCLHEVDSGFLGLAERERFEYLPAQAVLTTEEPGEHVRGFAEYPRHLLRPDYDYEFRYACVDSYAFQLPFKIS
ncbi:MAG: hypothetical protein OZ934_05765 [Anaerolineae bacterium]|nr:hypothetical protein [Anaerolineae bacterium]